MSNVVTSPEAVERLAEMVGHYPSGWQTAATLRALRAALTAAEAQRDGAVMNWRAAQTLVERMAGQIEAAASEMRERAKEFCRQRQEAYEAKAMEAVAAGQSGDVEAAIAAAYETAVSGIDALPLTQGGSDAEWQPIETAPHEELVLLFCPEIGPYNRQRVELGYASQGWRSGAYSTMSRHAWATHWMPLPAPPKGGSDAA
jgi:hypothetical protein